MTVPAITDLGQVPSKMLSLRQRCEILRSQLEAQRSSFIAVWKDCNDYILPQRGRFYVTDVNRGDRRNLKIVDSTGTIGARVLAAGMVAGMTSPARPWFELTTRDPKLAEVAEVKAWLHDTADVIRGILLRSNFYNEIPVLYGDIGIFGTGALMMVEDDDDVIRFYDFPVGSYCASNDARRQVRIFSRVFQLTVQQTVERWGNIDPRTGLADFERGQKSALSLMTQTLYLRSGRLQPVNIVQVVQPNLSYDGDRIESKYKRYESVYYEISVGNKPFGPDDRDILAHEGYDEFPILVARWETSGDDVYGTNWPGLTALGDIKQLQTMTKRGGQATEKYVNPPMTGPATLRSAAASILPGNITYNDVTQGQLGFRPIHEIAQLGSAIQALREDKAETQARIKEALFVNLFLMLEQSDRRDFTATEIMERKEEKLLVVGPVLEQVSGDVLSPVISRTYAAALRRGMIPDVPQSLQGATLVPVYVSMMASAQRQAGLAGMERFAGFVAQVAQVDPSVLDTVDGDELIEEYADGAGIPPSILRNEDAVHQIRAQRQQQQAQAQAAENAPKVAGAVKDLGLTSMQGDTALAKLAANATARRSLGATQQPVS